MFRSTCLLGFILLTWVASAEERTWHARVGDFSVQAELVDVRGSHVVLKRTDGRVVEVPLDKLSLADVRYVQQVLREAETMLGGGDGAADAGTRQLGSEGMQVPPPAATVGAAAPRPGAAPPLAVAGRRGWQVAPDPPLGVPQFPPQIQLAVPVQSGMGSSLLFPAQPSPFVLVRTGGTFDKARQVWDLRNGTKLREIQLDAGGPSALDLTGRRVAVVPMHKGKIQVWDVQSGQMAREFELSHWAERVHLVEFAGLERLVAVLDRTKEIAVWDLATGTKAASYSAADLPSARHQYAVSPGGHYLAFPVKGTLQLIDLRNGVLAGELTPPAGSKGAAMKVEAVSFSPDGQECAALLADGPGSALVVWNLADGRLATDLRFVQHLQKTIPEARAYQGRPLEWFPGRGSWLVFGRGVVDREIGGPVWIESLPAGSHLASEPRLLLDGQRMVALAGPKDGQRLQVLPLPADEIAAGIELVRSGATAKDAGLPPITIPDWSTVNRLTFERQANRWDYHPLPVNDGKPLLSQPLDVNVRSVDVRGLFFSAAAAKVIVASEKPDLPTPTSVPTGRQLDRFDLSSRQRDARFEVPFATELVDVDATGELLLCRIADDQDRLDVWSIADAKHVAGFRPYQTEEPDAQRVSWAAFAGGGRLLTINAKGQLVAWQLPDCRVAYTLDIAPQTAARLNPARTRLAVYHGDELHFLETNSGRCAATLPRPELPQGFTVLATAFRPDDQRLAAVVSSAGIPHLVVWDLATGERSTQFPLGREARGLSWAGEEHVLLHGDAGHVWLVDLQREAIVWKYSLPFGRQAAASPDGAHWFAGGEDGSGYAKLAAVVLPDESAAKLIRDMAGFEPLIGPGTEIALQVAIPPPPQADKQAGLRADAEQHLTAALTKNGLRVVPQAAVQLQVSLVEQPTSDTITYRRIGRLGQLNVPVSDLQAKVQLGSGGGEVYWSKTASFKTGQQSGFIEHVPDDVDTAVYIRMKQWQAALSWLKALAVPPRLFHPEVAEGLGDSKLTPGGAVRIRAIEKMPPKPSPGGQGSVAVRGRAANAPR